MTDVTPDAPLSILVVDDDALVREVTATMLSDVGHSVHEAADGAEALDFLKAGARVDLVITDINMPRMGGLELVQETRERWPHMPVLLMSGRPQPPTNHPYVAKPFGWDTLVQAVARVARDPNL